MQTAPQAKSLHLSKAHPVLIKLDSTIREWDQGETRPGPALKLLNVLADKGLQAIM
jgi:DNA-binding transcriptional regulator YiaG